MKKGVSERVAELWKLHSAQQLFYKFAMREEIPRDLRSLCGKGYLISSVCMSEISEIYDQVRCPIGDCPLQFPESKVKPDKVRRTLYSSVTEYVIGYFKFKQGEVLKKYAKILAHFEGGEVYIKVFSDHIGVLNGLTEKLERVGR